MQIEPWMLAAYMVGGVCFFLFISMKVMPRYASKKILSELNGPRGKEVMRAIMHSALESLQEEYEIDGPPDGDGKPTKLRTTIGAEIMGAVGASVVQHFKMAFLGEKGLLSRELGSIQNEGLMSAIPANLQPYMAMLAPYIKKYPVIGALVSAFIAMKAGEGPTSLGAALTGAPMATLGAYKGL